MDNLNKKKKIVKNALREINKHRKTIEKYYSSVSEPFKIENGSLANENLWKIMLLNIQSRGGPKLNDHKIKIIKNKFQRKVNFQKIKNFKNKDKFKSAYREIIDLPKIGPKIAAVFMKEMVYQFEIFKELKRDLYLPIDLHVEKIITKKLQLFKQKDIHKQNPLNSAISGNFQTQLNKIHKPRVELDAFWFIGYIFCTKRSGLVCNELCWIRKYCKDKFKD